MSDPTRVTITDGQATNTTTGEVIEDTPQSGAELTGEAEGVESANEPPTRNLDLGIKVSGPEGADQATQDQVESESEAEGAEQSEEAPAPAALSTDSLQEMSLEYAQAGKLSDDTYNKLAAAGVDRAVVDQVIEGQAALRDLQVAEAMFDLDITKTQYQEMAKWVGDNWSEDQIAAYNRMVEGSDAGARRMAMESLKAAATGRGQSGGKLAGTTQPQGIQPFQSTAEMVEAMKHPDYKARKNPYFSEVQARLQASRRI
jgi:hypothetical protein